MAKRRMSKKATAEQKDRARRMAWWHDARFGMFVHWGLYSILERHEWVMNRERIPVAEYEKLAPKFKPRPRCMRDWAKLAKAAGQKYMVMTTKHHEGYCLWDSEVTDYCAGKLGPQRDLVREYVEACREFGLKVGFYYSLMDWHHPDGARCAKNEAARKRFIAYTHGLVRELMSNYGTIDILWYDVSWPLDVKGWESRRMNRMVRKLQPDIIINNRSQLPEDFGTPEGHIKAADGDRAWEACMTYNNSWGYQPSPPEEWHSNRAVIEMLRSCTAQGGGNLLLNIGPRADGSVPEEATERLPKLGKWLAKYGEGIYGPRGSRVTRCDGGRFEWMPCGNFTLFNNRTLYYWVDRWPGSEIALGGIKGKVKRVRLLPDLRKSYQFEQSKDRLVIRGLPRACPDKIAGVALLRLDFASAPSQKLGAGCVVL